MSKLALIMLIALTGCAHGVVDATEETDDEAVIDLSSGEAVPLEEAVQAIEDVETAAPPSPFIGEATACAMISESYRAHGLAIGCATTIRVCPDLLRYPFGESCLQYVRKTVEACTQRLESAETCDQLQQISCAVEPVVDSSPKGCPDVAD